MKYCPLCTQPLRLMSNDTKPRLACPDSVCGFVFWDNPVPVVAAIVETPEGVVLAHNRTWPKGLFSVISGFLESAESPQAAIERETVEELGLTTHDAALLGHYPLLEQNQLIIAYHLRAEGAITLNEELDAFKIIPATQLGGYDFGPLTLTRRLVDDWLAT